MGDAVNNSRIVKGVKGTWKKGSEKIADIAKPNVIGLGDPTSLGTPVSDPNAEFFVSLARLQEGKGSVVRAEDQYRKALEVNSRNLKALMGLARLVDRLGRLDEATELYLQASRHHSKEPAPFNDLALCYAKQGKLNESVAALTRAIELQPYRKLYRNNLATVLVEAGRTDAALQHLIAAHGEAVAHYNLGYLLNQKGLRQPASYHFAKAVELDPSFTEARQWYELTAARSGPALTPGGGLNAMRGQRVPNSTADASRRYNTTAPPNQQFPSPGGVITTQQPPYKGGTQAPQIQPPALGSSPGSLHNGPLVRTPTGRPAYSNRDQLPAGRDTYRYSSGQGTPAQAEASQTPRSASPNGSYVAPTPSLLAPGQMSVDPPVAQRVDPTMPPLPSSDLDTTPAMGVRPFDPPRFPAPESDITPPGVQPPEPPTGSTYYPPSRY